MLEFLLIFSCMNNTGCGEVTSAYYITKPAVKERIDYYENRARDIAGEHVTNYVFPIAMVGAGYQGGVKLSKNLTLRGTNKWQDATLLYSYPF